MRFFVLSFITCLLLANLLKKILAKSRLSTNKERPMLLGISLYAAVLLTVIFTLNYYKISNPFIGKILICSFLVLILGIVDDIKNLSVGVKLSGQVAIAFIVVLLGVKTTISYFPGWCNILLTILWITALINAFNLLDIMDGLCTGVSLITSIFFLLISLITHAWPINLFFAALSGAILAAFIYNFPPAKLYLGDAGSMLLGFIFACSALQISYAPDFKEGLSLFVPLLIVALPLYDLTFTIFARQRKGIPVVKKSKDHLVFIMKKLGFSTKKILAFVYAGCIFFGSSAMLLKILPGFSKMWLLLVIAAISLFLAVAVAKAETRRLK